MFNIIELCFWRRFLQHSLYAGRSRSYNYCNGFLS